MQQKAGATLYDGKATQEIAKWAAVSVFGYTYNNYCRTYALWLSNTPKLITKLPISPSLRQTRQYFYGTRNDAVRAITLRAGAKDTTTRIYGAI